MGMRTMVLLAAAVLTAGCASLGDYQELSDWTPVTSTATLEMQRKALTDGYVVAHMRILTGTYTPSDPQAFGSTLLVLHVCPPGIDPTEPSNWTVVSRARVSWTHAQPRDWGNLSAPVREGAHWKLRYHRPEEPLIGREVRAFWVPLD